MAANRIETLRNYFNAGDEPTEAQFYEVMQTIGHKYYQGTQAKTAGFTAAKERFGHCQHRCTCLWRFG